jgi:hypothetical protein
MLKKRWCRNRNAIGRNTLPAQDSQIADDCIEVLATFPSPTPETLTPVTPTTPTTTTTPSPLASPSKSPRKKTKALNVEKSHSNPSLGHSPARTLRPRFFRKDVSIDI